MWKVQTLTWQDVELRSPIAVERLIEVKRPNLP